MRVHRLFRAFVGRSACRAHFQQCRLAYLPGPGKHEYRKTFADGVDSVAEGALVHGCVYVGIPLQCKLYLPPKRTHFQKVCFGGTARWLEEIGIHGGFR